MSYHIYNGRERQDFELPLGWHLLSYYSQPKQDASPLSVKELTEEAIAHPIGISPLDGRTLQGQRVAIISDDGARPTPVREILPVLLKELFRNGVKREAIDIVIGLGTHAPMDEGSLNQKIGEEILQTYRVSQHHCRSQDLVPVGRLQTGGEVRINRIVAQSDIRIGLGSIFPHPMNGYGGGPKIIFPGVSNYEAIREHHLAMTIHPKSIYGNVEGNPFYREILRVADMAKLDYSLNCVLNNQDQIAAVLFGSFKGVHEKGATLSKMLCGMKVNGKSDMTIISAYPYEESLQVIKPLIIGSLITKLGGTVILVAKTRDQMSDSFVELFEKIDISSSGKLKEYAIGRFRSNQLLLEGGAIDFNCALFFALLCKEKHRVVVVSRELGNQGMQRMGCIPYEDLKTALSKEAERQPSATVNILPLGGTTLPIMSEGLCLYD